MVNWDPLVDLVARLRTSNYEPTAMVTSPGLKATLAKIRAVADGQYLAMPEYLRDVPLLPMPVAQAQMETYLMRERYNDRTSHRV